FRDQFCRFRRFVILDAESPLEIGFDEARNRTLREARGDWIMWMDTDEDLIHPERLHKYLRHNMFDGYGIAQHHMSADPVGVLTTDWPVRVFRNVPYLRFQGVVHEHPDDVERPNSGPRAPAQIVDLHILHHGYTTEDVRRRRFQRNLPLIKRDRKQYPDRLLGRLLWMRDLAHMCMFEAERTGGVVTEEMRNWAKLGMLQWEALLEESDRPIAARMLRDGLEFYSTLVGVLGEGFEAHVQLHAAKGAPARLEAGPRRAGRFLNRQHFEKFMKLCIDEQTQKFDSRYF
ncbi:MAG TPA: glycosyltransferase, partial [Steroidobacteraceae bacterium]